MKSRPQKVVIYGPESLPVRGAWIEIDVVVEQGDTKKVAPRKGSVD